VICGGRDRITLVWTKYADCGDNTSVDEGSTATAVAVEACRMRNVDAQDLHICERSPPIESSVSQSSHWQLMKPSYDYKPLNDENDNRLVRGGII